MTKENKGKKIITFFGTIGCIGIAKIFATSSAAFLASSAAVAANLAASASACAAARDAASSSFSCYALMFEYYKNCF